MDNTQLKLLTTRRFMPLFLVQFFGSLNDNFFRSALAVMITYQFTGSSISWLNAGVMVALCSVLLVIPFPLLSPLAGQLADKYDKSKLIRIIKLFEIMIMLTACYGFIASKMYLLMFLLLLSGIQSAFFGPLKYSILADHLDEKELLAGNSLISGATYASILLGLMMGGLAFEFSNGGSLVGITLAIGSLIGVTSSIFIPKNKPASPELKINKNIFSEACNIVKHAHNNRPVFLSILGLSWFMLISAIFMGQFPTYAKIIGTNNEVYTLFLVIFSLGISLGSLLCNVLLKGNISARYTPIATFLISIGVFGLVATSKIAPSGQELIGIWAFVSNYENWTLMFSMLVTAIAGGIYIVPLYTIMQSEADEGHRARVIAARNVLNSIFITTAMLISAILLAVGLNVVDLFLLLGALNIIVAIITAYLLPELPNTILNKTGIKFQIPTH